jgi:hypothetical protein
MTVWEILVNRPTFRLHLWISWDINTLGMLISGKMREHAQVTRGLEAKPKLKLMALTASLVHFPQLSSASRFQTHPGHGWERSLRARVCDTEGSHSPWCSWDSKEVPTPSSEGSLCFSTPEESLDLTLCHGKQKCFWFQVPLLPMPRSPCPETTHLPFVHLPKVMVFQ